MSLARLLEQLRTSDSSSDSDSDSDNGAAGALALLAAVAAGPQSDPVAGALAALVALEGLKDALKGDNSDTIKVGDMVKVTLDADTVEALQEGHGGWNPDIVKDLNKVGCVVKMLLNDPIVHFGRKMWRLNVQVCSKLTIAEKKAMFSFGDRVYVELSDKIAEAMQKTHGGWNKLMGSDLQNIGKVLGVDSDGDVTIQFWTRSFCLNSASCKILKTQTCCSFAKGDKVFMDNDVDIEVLKAMLASHGGWNPAIVDDLGRIGTVQDVDKDGDLVIKMGKRKWALHPDVCTKITAMASPGGEFFGIGDEVSIELPADIVKDMQKDHGEWSDNIKQDIGKKGKVIAILQDGDLHVQFSKNKWRLNRAVCTKQQSGRTLPFQVGQRVTVDMEPEAFLTMQIGHGGVDASMLTDLGKVGKILEILPDKDLMVQFTPNVWTLNPAICTKLADVTKPSFAVGDRVFIALDPDIIKEFQKDHGGFVETMYRLFGKVGKVCKILPTGDIVVLYGLLPMVLNPAIVLAMITVDTGAPSSAVINTSPFSVGDLVRIEIQMERVKDLQTGHGGWNDQMLPLLGKVGMVQKVDDDGDLVVCYGNKSACINPAACVLVKPDIVEDNTQAATSTDDIESRMECQICLNNNITVVFGCGHGTCEECGKQLNDCHLCRARITHRTNIFF